MTLLSAAMFMKVRSMVDCCPVFDCNVGIFGVLVHCCLSSLCGVLFGL
jgi:hypothetical protein